MWAQRLLHEWQVDAACNNLRLQTEFFRCAYLHTTSRPVLKPSICVHSMSGAARSVIFDYDGTLVDTAGGISDEDEHRKTGTDWVVGNSSEIPRVLE